MMRYFIHNRILPCLFALLLIINCYGQTAYSPEVEAQIRKVENSLSGRIKIDGKTFNILERMDHYKVKGVSIAVVDDYQVVWAKGYGWADEKEKRPVTTETLFEPGSISKSLNAVGILKLVQDGKLDLEKDINEYLVSWKFPYDSVSNGKKITLANLLSHTAGLTVHGFPGYERNDTIPSVPDILNGKPPANSPAVRSEFEPGLRFQYSGGGTTISQLILTDMTKQPYDKYLYENVLAPMGMTHSFFTQPPPENKLQWVASGYNGDGSPIEHKFHVYPELAAAGLWMTPTDLCNYIVESQLALEGKSSKVLNQDMTKLRMTPYLESGSAFGVFLEDHQGIRYFTHGARNAGFSGLYFGSMEGGKGVAIFINSDNPALLTELLTSIVVVYNWNGFEVPESVTTVPIPDADAKKYEGFYVYEGKISEIARQPGGLFFWADGQDYKMYKTPANAIISVELLSEKFFALDSSGHVTGYSRTIRGKEYPFARKVSLTDIDTLIASPGQLNSMGWHLVQVKRFDDAIPFLQRSVQVEPNDIAAQCNLAHCYLFKNEYDKALGIYRKYLDKMIFEQSSFRDMIKRDFDFFRANGFDKKLLDKATADLKL